MSTTSQAPPITRPAPGRAPRPTAGAIASTVFFSWLAIAVASLALWPIYQDPRFVVLVVITTVVGTAIAVAGAWWRWPTAIVVLAGLVAYGVLGVPLAVPGATVSGVLPTLDGLVQLLSSTALGWKQLVTITLPVGDYQGLLVPAFVLVLVVSVAAVTAALRSRRGGLAVLGPVLLLVAGIVFGPESVARPVVVALALLLVIIVWLAWRRAAARRAAIRRLTAATTDVGDAPSPLGPGLRLPGLRSLVSGTVIVALAGAAAVVATANLEPSAERTVLRTEVEQPFDPRDYVSPLAAFRKYLQPGNADSVMFTVSGLAEGSLLRIATLDSYDGIVYSVGSDAVSSDSGSFTRVPYRFDQSAVQGTEADIDVVIGAWDDVWVPTVGKLESITFEGSDASRLSDSFYYNDSGATAAVIGGLATGDAYQLEAVIPRQPDASELASLTPGSASVPALGTLPVELDLVLDGYVGQTAGDGARLVAMLDGLRANGYVSHGIGDEVPSRSGHSAERVTRLLTDQRMIGDAEQYAVTAALMARQLGFPARVVFGFAPEVSGSGVTEVTGSSVSAWIEVDTTQYGWVAIDPTPPVRPIPDEQPEDPTVISRPPSVIQPPVIDPPVRDTQTPPESTQDQPEATDPVLAIILVVVRVLGWVLLAAGILAAPFLAVIAAKVQRRRRRRRAPTAAQRISGGWQEFQDAVVDHGYTPPDSATRTEVAATVGGTRPALLATVADHAVFSPEVPDDEEADRVWLSVRELREGLDAGLTRRERWRARVSLRSFGVGSLLSRKGPKT